MSEDSFSRRSAVLNFAVGIVGVVTGAVLSPFAQVWVEGLTEDEHRLDLSISGLDLGFMLNASAGMSSVLQNIPQGNATPISDSSTTILQERPSFSAYRMTINIQNTGDFREENVTAVINIALPLNDEVEIPKVTQVTIEATNTALASEVTIEDVGQETPVASIGRAGSLRYLTTIPRMVRYSGVTIIFEMNLAPEVIVVGGQSSDIAFEGSWTRPNDVNPDISG